MIKNYTMKNIINITVATDFSETSRNAYRYAKNMANSLNASLTVVHVKPSFVSASQTAVDPVFEDNSDLIKMVEKLIAEENIFIDNIISKNETKIKILLGNPELVLTDLSEIETTDLLVIGTTGSSDVISKIFGSTSINVSNKAKCPVIVVAKDVKWQPIKKMMFASNYDSMVPEVIDHIKQFASYIDAKMHFVNVRNFDPVYEIKQKDLDWNAVEAENPDIHFEKHTVYGNDTIGELKTYGEQNFIDLMVFVSKERNFWQNLLHKSMTENMALTSNIPIMVLHLDDK